MFAKKKFAKVETLLGLLAEVTKSIQPTVPHSVFRIEKELRHSEGVTFIEKCERTGNPLETLEREKVDGNFRRLESL
jgi:hypothetical protein